MPAESKFIIKRSESHGGYSNMFGRGLTWGKWSTITTAETIEAATAEADRLRAGRTMVRCAVFHKGKIAYKTQSE